MLSLYNVTAIHIYPACCYNDAAVSVAWQVDGQIISRIAQGLLCLVGIKDSDTEKDAEFMYVFHSCLHDRSAMPDTPHVTPVCWEAVLLWCTAATCIALADNSTLS